MSSASNNAAPAAPPPTLYSDLPKIFPEIHHKEATDTSGGGQASYANNKVTGQYIYIQLCDAPKKGATGGDITLPFGISPIFTGKKKGKSNNNVQVDPEKKAAYDKRKNVDFGLLPKHVAAIEAFDAWNIKDMAANSEAIFDRKLSEAKIKEKYLSALKRPGDDDDEEDAGAEKKEKKPLDKNQQGFRVRLRTKLNCVGNMVPKVSVVQPDGKRRPGTWEDLNKPRSTCIPILRYSGRWFSSGKFGPTFEISNVLVYPAVDEQPEFPFVWNSDEAAPAKEDEEMPQAPDNSASAPAPPSNNAPAPPPPPTNPNEPVHDYKFQMAD